jgi:hypothetical protein
MERLIGKREYEDQSVADEDDDKPATETVVS